jgi:hypothetical protein
MHMLLSICADEYMHVFIKSDYVDTILIYVYTCAFKHTRKDEYAYPRKYVIRNMYLQRCIYTYLQTNIVMIVVIMKYIPLLSYRNSLKYSQSSEGRCTTYRRYQRKLLRF